MDWCFRYPGYLSLFFNEAVFIKRQFEISFFHFFILFLGSFYERLYRCPARKTAVRIGRACSDDFCR